MPDQETQTDLKAAASEDSGHYASAPAGSNSSSQLSTQRPPINPEPPAALNISIPGDEESQRPATPFTLASDNESIASVSLWSNLRGIIIEKTLNLGYICIFISFLIIWGHKPCDQSLALYLTVKASVIAFKLPDKILTSIAETRPQMKSNVILRLFKFLWMTSDYFAFCWFLVGNVYLWRCVTCSDSNPHLYWLVFADTIFTWTVMILSFALLMIANVIRRRQERYETHMAALASMGAGASRGLSPRELARLRTFSFRMMDKNAPQPPSTLASNIESLANVIPMTQMTQMTKTRLTRWRSESNLFMQRRNRMDSLAEEVEIPFDESTVGGPKFTIISEEMLEKMDREELEEKRRNISSQSNPADPNLIENSGQLSPLDKKHQLDSPATIKVPSIAFSESGQPIPVPIPPHLRPKQINRSRSLDSVATSHISTQVSPSFRQSRTSSYFENLSQINSISLTKNPSSSSTNNALNQNSDSDPKQDSKPTSSHETCAICFEIYESGNRLRELACSHVFHKDCIDNWLRGDPDTGFGGHRTCPLCVQEAIRPEDRDEEWLEAEFDYDENEIEFQPTTPVEQEHRPERRNRRRFFRRRSRSASRQASPRQQNNETEAEFMERVLRESEMGIVNDGDSRQSIDIDMDRVDRRRTWTFVRSNHSRSPRRSTANNRSIDGSDSEVIREEEEENER